MKKYITYTLVGITSLTPFTAFAALGGVKDLLISFQGILGLLIPIIFGLALVFFFWGTAQFILNAGDSKTREEGKNKMLWGIIALFVMVSIYGIIKFIGSTLDITPSSTTP